jgi:hypothetical protein
MFVRDENSKKERDQKRNVVTLQQRRIWKSDWKKVDLPHFKESRNFSQDRLTRRVLFKLFCFRPTSNVIVLRMKSTFTTRDEKPTNW